MTGCFFGARKHFRNVGLNNKAGKQMDEEFHLNEDSERGQRGGKRRRSSAHEEGLN